MDFNTYLLQFDEILNNPNPSAPYNDPAFMEFTKLNRARLNRWLKQGTIHAELEAHIKGINKTQSWIIITEPWCGDAAHIVPFIHLITKLNPLIHANYELRDAPPFRIEKYLTHGSKSIPILIVQDEKGNDIFHWGSRPEPANKLYDELKKKGTPIDEIKIELQNWYNANKGMALQQELMALPGVPNTHPEYSNAIPK
ncbi:MAG: thioredoxin family protein [Chitinophagaceae bacterium]|nr:thioredoxin family protein [Bacteroidota bacterium]MCC6258197.1 thioredoxin family protein [Chitinophagaceae bacterium]MCW5916146.1 thioredoxin family protein [Ferruginibacter sp.]